MLVVLASFLGASFVLKEAISDWKNEPIGTGKGPVLSGNSFEQSFMH